MFESGNDIIRTEETLWWDKKIIYANGSVGIESKTLWWDTKIVISKNGEEIATALSKDTAWGTQSIKTTYKDGSSGTTIHSPNALLWPENMTFRDGKSTNESYHSSAIHHDTENKSSNIQESNNNDTHINKSQWSHSHSYQYNNSKNGSYSTNNKEVSFTRIKTQAEIQYEQETKEGLAKVAKSEQQDELSLIIHTNKNPEVQIAAIRKLKSRGTWFESISMILLRDKYNDRVRHEIFKNTRNIPIEWTFDSIEFIMKYDPSRKMRLEAIKKLNINKHQGILISAIGKETDPEVQLEILKYIKTPSLEDNNQNRHLLMNIERIAEGKINANIEVRKEAIKKIINNEILYNIAERDSNGHLAILAVNRISDKEYLNKLRKSSIYQSVRKIAKERSDYRSPFTRMMIKLFS